MTTEQLKAVFLKAHDHERKIVFRNMAIIFVIILFAIGLAYHYSVLSAILTSFFGQSTAVGGSDMANTYYKYMIPLVFISIAFYPLYLIYTIQKRPKKIDAVISSLNNGEKGMGMSQNTEYKTTVPIIFLKLRLDPVDYLSFGIGNKKYKLPIIEDFIVEVKTCLSGANISKTYKIWSEMYNDSSPSNTEKTLLKPLSDFEVFAEKEIYDSLNKMDKGRKQSKKTYLIYMVFIGLFMGTYMYLNMFHSAKLANLFDDPMMLTYAMIALVVGISFLGFLYSKFMFRNSNASNTGNFTNFKEEIFTKILNFINPEFEYLEYGHVSKGDINDSNLFIQKDYKVEGNDQIMGFHNGTPFQICDLEISHTPAFRSEKSGPNQVFKGQYFVAKFHKAIEAPILIHSKISFLKSFAENEMAEYIDDFSESVKIDDEEFMKYFKVNCDNPNLAKEVLNQKMINHIKSFSKKSQGKLYISIENQQIVIANNSGKDKFETGLFTSLQKSFVNDIYQYLYEQLSIIDQLN